jgi:hypothetical protein
MKSGKALKKNGADWHLTILLLAAIRFQRGLVFEMGHQSEQSSKGGYVKSFEGILLKWSAAPKAETPRNPINHHEIHHCLNVSRRAQFRIS